MNMLILVIAGGLLIVLAVLSLRLFGRARTHSPSESDQPLLAAGPQPDSEPAALEPDDTEWLAKVYSNQDVPIPSPICQPASPAVSPPSSGPGDLVARRPHGAEHDLLTTPTRLDVSGVAAMLAALIEQEKDAAVAQALTESQARTEQLALEAAAADEAHTSMIDQLRADYESRLGEVDAHNQALRDQVGQAREDLDALLAAQTHLAEVINAAAARRR